MREDAAGIDFARDVEPDELAALDRSGLPDRDPDTLAPASAGIRRGRGATINPASRYDRQAASPFDDGWSGMAGELAELPPLPTTLHRDASRSVISWNDSPDIGFDRAINPYRGCEHGCVYCYARPTHAYLGWSPGLDFETKLLYKPDVAELLERELRKPGYVARPIALGSNTDPYQPVERTLQLTRAVLGVLDRCDHPCTIVTKSAGVLRDLDILAGMARRNLVRVWLSVTTLDPRLARGMEPRAATAERRLQALAGLARAGVPAGVLAAPMIPGLNDAELERILEAAAAAGAGSAGYVLLRLPHELRRDLPGLAGAARAGPGAACVGADPPDPRRRAERRPLRPPFHRQRRLCGPAGAAVRPRRPAIRPGRNQRAGLQPLPPAAAAPPRAGRGAAQPAVSTPLAPAASPAPGGSDGPFVVAMAGLGPATHRRAMHGVDRGWPGLGPAMTGQRCAEGIVDGWVEARP